VIYYQVFLLSPLLKVTQYRKCTRLREFEEIEISMQAVDVTVNSKEEN